MFHLAEIAYHNIDPVAFSVGIPVRWYGIGYLLTFAIAYVVLTGATKRGHLRLTSDDVTTYLMFGMIGVFAGGRIGDLLLYSDYFTAGKFITAPMELVGFKNGSFEGIRGLSFHGGLTGVILAGSFFVWLKIRAERKKLDPALVAAEGRGGFWDRYQGLWANVFDMSVLVVPIGIFMVRIANFVNGELYGRLILDANGKPVTDAANAPAWAMRFPTSPEGFSALKEHYFHMFSANLDATTAAERGGRTLGEFVLPMAEGAARKLPVDPEVWDLVSKNVALRHPSQVYQALLEGLMVLALVWAFKSRVSKSGYLAGIFMISYGLARIPMELFREPDPVFEKELSWWGSVLDAINLTQGQFLSALMVLVGSYFIWHSWRSSNPWLISPFKSHVKTS